MKIPSRHNTNSRQLEVKMTPMIDVVFLLLIFFVCTASFQVMEEILPTNLLAEGSIETVEPTEPKEDELEPILIEVRNQDGVVFWLMNQSPITELKDVRGRLSALAEVTLDVPIILDIAESVPMGSVIDLYDTCRLEGFQKIQFAAKSAPAS
jgi:biopolymer transport protein ExbD